MNKLLVIIATAIIIMPVAAHADNKYKKQENKVAVLHDDMDSLRLSFITGELVFGEKTFLGEHFSTLTIADYTSSTSIGCPDLPVFSQFIEVPICKGFDVRVSNAVFDTIEAPQKTVLPVQPPRRKSDTSTPVLVMNKEVYANDVFYSMAIASVEPIGIARDRNLARLQFSPVSYNPVSHKIIICRQVTITVVYRDVDKYTTQDLFNRHNTPAFAPPANRINNLFAKGINTSAPIRYLIVSHSMFRGHLDSFIDWKRRKGFIVDVVYTDNPNVGTTTTSIANYIKSQYSNATSANPAPTYLLLVGDMEQIPAFVGVSNNEHFTDLYYTTWNIGDDVPDCYCGRFSAQNVEQLIPQIEKTLMHEQYTFADPTFLDRAIMVSGVDGGNPGDNGYNCGDPSMDYVITNYINGYHNFQQVRYFKNDTSIVPSVPNVIIGSSNESNAEYVRSCYSKGASIINYTAHGSPTCWGTPYLGTENVPEMTNHQRFGLMIGNCCQSNTFSLDACLGEALLRQGNYCGAVGYIGASNSTYWSYDFFWTVGARSNIGANMSMNYSATQLGAYDCLNHTHNEVYSKWATTQGAIMMAGNLAVASVNGTNALYYWEIYHLMGDPSLMPYLTQPNVLNLTMQPVITTVATTLQITTEPHVYVAITDTTNHTLIASAFANTLGIATIDLPYNLPVGTYEVTASAQNYRTALRSLQVVEPTSNAPYTIATHITPTTSVNAGSSVPFTISVRNIGTAHASNVTVRLASNNPRITIPNNSIVVPRIEANETLELTTTLDANFAQQITDGSRVIIEALVSWGNNTTTVDFPVYVNAPVLTVVYSDNMPTVLPGNTTSLEATIYNHGHAALPSSRLALQSPTSLLSITEIDSTPFTIAPETSSLCHYTLQADNRLPHGILIPLRARVNGFYSPVDDTLNLFTSLPATETFEGGNFHLSGWSQGSIPWTFTSETAADGNMSLRSNSSTTHNQTSDITLNYTFTHSDSIRFRYKVSSEGNYDKFKLYIDNEEVFNASGQVDWVPLVFPVPEGSHSFRFSYEKDYSVSDNSDCAWIDHIILPPAITPAFFQSEQVCVGSTFIIGEDTINTDNPTSGVHVSTTSNGIELVDYVVLSSFNVDTFVTICDSLTFFGQAYTQSCADTFLLPNTSGCDSVLTLHLTVNHSVSTNIEVSVEGNSYQWGDSIYTASGEYQQYFTSAVGCDSLVTLNLTLIHDSVAINNLSPFTFFLSPYPNPTTGTVTFAEIPDGTPIEVYDITGRKVSSFKIQNSKTTVDLTPLPTGIYTLRLTLPTGVTTCRVMKK